MKQKIDDIEETAEDENNTALNEAAKQIVSNRLIVENKTQKLNTDKIQYKLVMSKCVKEDYIKESKLRKRKFKMAGELQNWIMKYDGDMGWRQVKKIFSKYLRCLEKKLISHNRSSNELYFLLQREAANMINKFSCSAYIRNRFDFS